MTGPGDTPRVPPTRYVAARHGGTRYHRHAECVGLNATALANAPVDSISRATVLQRRLLPCALCQPAQVTPLAAV